MKKILIVLSILVSTESSIAQLKLTGGVSFTRGTIDAEVLQQVIQQKQEEVFTRLFSNIIVKYFENKTPDKGIFNFPTYYSVYNLMSDLTVGKTKTTISKAVLNSMAELAYTYNFVRYYQEKKIAPLAGGARSTAVANQINKLQLITAVNSSGERSRNMNNIKLFNFYMEAAFDVLAKSDAIQKRFYFKRPITATEVDRWYQSLGLLNTTRANLRNFKNEQFQDLAGNTINLSGLVKDMQGEVDNYLNTAAGSNDNTTKGIAGLKKDANGFEDLSKDEVNFIKLTLLEYAKKTDFLFDQNLVKSLISLTVENTHFGLDDQLAIKEVYVDAEGLILSLDKEFVKKNKRSSVASPAFFVNPRLFFTIGASTGFFLNHQNQLDQSGPSPAALKNITLAAEKIGFRIKLWDGGYTHAFGPGEVYKFHGNNYVWTEPQRKPLISSVYYNIYTSGLLYNVLDLKTNKNFDFGYLGVNVGLIFFNGLEFSPGVGFIYQDGLSARNSFFKLDFDIPIIDYLSALSKKNK